jgi:U3 small nucleolar RNA-associated protein 13
LRPGSLQVVTASRSLQLTSWDAESGQVLRTWKAHEAPVIVMAFDPSGTLLATGSADSTIKLWDLDKGICTHNFRGHRGLISALRFHPDGNRWTLISGSDDCQIRVWDLLTKQCVAVLDSHVSVVRGLSVSPCGWFLLSASRDKVVNVWDLRKNELVQTFPILESMESVGFVPPTLVPSNWSNEDSLVFYTAGEKGMVRFWRFDNGQLVWEQSSDVHGRHSLTDTFISSSLNQMVTITSDQNILFHTFTPQGLQCCRQIIGYNEEVIDLGFFGSRMDKLAVVTNSEQLRLYDFSNNDSTVVYGHTDTILAMDVSTVDRNWIATGSKDKTVRLWRVLEDSESENNRTTQCVPVATCVGHAEAIGALTFSKRSIRFLLTASQDRTVKKWLLPTMSNQKTLDLNQIRSEYTVKVHDKDINSIAVSPNDKFFATGSQDKTAKVKSFDPVMYIVI